jgi:hypothetical protein
MAQVAHASVEFAIRYPEQARSTPIGIVLQVPDEQALLGYDAITAEPHVLFHEEDLGDEATALAVVSTGEYFANLPLAGKELAM